MSEIEFERESPDGPNERLLQIILFAAGRIALAFRANEIHDKPNEKEHYFNVQRSLLRDLETALVNAQTITPRE